MDVKTCKRCKKLFQYVTGPAVCPRCKEVEEQQFQRVKEYLIENPGASLNVVNEETGVSVQLIQYFLKQGRLQVAPGSPISLECEKCGKPITTGRYCKACQGQLYQELVGAAHDIQKAQGDKEKLFHKGDKMRTHFEH